MESLLYHSSRKPEVTGEKLGEGKKPMLLKVMWVSEEAKGQEKVNKSESGHT